MGKSFKELQEEYEAEEIRLSQAKHLPANEQPQKNLQADDSPCKEQKSFQALPAKPKKALPRKRLYPENRVRKIQKKIYFSAQEWALAQGKLRNQSLSVYIRRIFLNKKPALLAKTGLVDLSRELSAIGNNLNQLAKRANEVRGITDADALLNLLQDLRGKLLACKEELEQ